MSDPNKLWHRLWHCKKSRPLADLAIGGAIFAVMVVVAFRYDAAEHWHALHDGWEAYQLDEIPIAFTVATAIFGWFAWRRWQDFRREAAASDAARLRLQQELKLREEMERGLKAAQHRAEAADRAKSEFLANMSHELRTPLNAILGFSEMMEHEVRGPLGDARYREYVGNIKESGAHLLSLINEILDLSKIEAGKLELYEEIFDLTQTAASAVRLVTAQAEKLGLALRTRTTPGPIALFGDARAVKQIMVNLLSNACKFSEEGGMVVLELAVDAGGNCIIKVRDSGIGMTPEEIELALKPFRRIDSYISRKRGGTGLGLPLVKALTELHGGRLVLESTPGRGTEVCVILPPERVVRDAEEITFERAAS